MVPIAAALAVSSDANVAMEVDHMVASAVPQLDVDAAFKMNSKEDQLTNIRANGFHIETDYENGKECLLITKQDANDNAACVAQVQMGYVKSNLTKHISPKFFYAHELQRLNESSDRGSEAATSFPKKLHCVGSTDSWLAFDWTDDEERHAYFLHNPFSRATVPLPELDAVVGDVSELFRIRKVLMRSTPDDLIVVMTNNWDLPIFSIQRGKGALLPQLQAAPFDFGTIIDIAFLENKLWGITKDQELISLPITFDDVHDIPMATTIEQLIWTNIDAAAHVAGDDEDEDGNNKGYAGDEQNNGASMSVVVFGHAAIMRFSSATL
ncbi:hypothetical protein TRIUR3_20723 [Triticum urartu]|uniref:KIB1-4 beta-propeller domain-containing protein n=1 Tax=Triticum urartu TaxID=4572 RepID=M8A2D8_TRIUA|nr:hypothetical protein TRIUR3_20723 [Triticum urartu]